jgi:hypothetical protein
MALMPAIPLLVGGCEDGPNQTYSPTPAGANLNGSNGTGGLGDGGAFTGNGNEGYDASFGGQNANDLCTATQEKAVWNELFNAPVLIPGLAAGLDAAGGAASDCASGWTQAGAAQWKYDATKESWAGCTVEQAEKVLCQGTATSVFYGVTATVGWGESLEFSVEYNPNNRIITDLLMETGFPGGLTATSSDGKTTYVVSLNNVEMTKSVSGGAPQNITLDWTNQSGMNAIANDLYDAMRNTFEPSFAPETDCTATGHCIVGNNGNDGGYLWFVPLGIAMFVDTTLGTPQVNSTIGLIDITVLKNLPFSNGTSLLQIDSAGVGPTNTTKSIGGTYGFGGDCVYQLGMKYGDFQTQCVQIYGGKDPDPATDDKIAQNKLFGGMAHSDEEYIFDVVGVDPLFVASSLPPNTVISDTDQPGPNDLAFDFRIDQNVLGPIANDYANNDATQKKDFHGLGLVTLEWANLVQQYMKNNYGVTSDLGDPGCMANPANPGNGKVCSGIEGIVTSAPVASISLPQMTANALGAAANSIAANSMGAGLKPSTWYQLFCADAGGLTPSGNPNGYQKCFGGNLGYPTPTGTEAAYYFDTMQKAVAASFGSNAIPETLGNRRFYFQEWIFALIKYLQSAADPNATLAEIDANPVDQNELFFDSNGGGFETAEYVYRDLVNSTGQPPLDVQLTIQLTTSIVNDFEFSRYNFRGESLLYQTLQTNPADKPGAEPLFLANLVGSPVLASTFGTYACASATGPTKGCTVLPAIDPQTGKSEWNGYEPAFGHSWLNIAALDAAPTPAPMTINTTDYTLIESAMVSVPVWSNPYDPTTATANDKILSALLPFLPTGAGTGFPVTIDGSRDKFYNTNELDFTGVSFGADVDWENVAFSSGSGTQNLPVVRAIEATDYLGLIPMCAEANAAGTGTDVLAIRMYQNGQDILDWLDAHPNATTDCGIQIKYSIYGNYADYISSLTNGVRVGLNAGFGGSVVADMTVFDPNVVPTLGQ